MLLLLVGLLLCLLLKEVLNSVKEFLKLLAVVTFSLSNGAWLLGRLFWLRSWRSLALRMLYSLSCLQLRELLLCVLPKSLLLQLGLLGQALLCHALGGVDVGAWYWSILLQGLLRHRHQRLELRLDALLVGVLRVSIRHPHALAHNLTFWGNKLRHLRGLDSSHLLVCALCTLVLSDKKTSWGLVILVVWTLARFLVWLAKCLSANLWRVWLHLVRHLSWLWMLGLLLWKLLLVNWYNQLLFLALRRVMCRVSWSRVQRFLLELTNVALASMLRMSGILLRFNDSRLRLRWHHQVI